MSTAILPCAEAVTAGRPCSSQAPRRRLMQRQARRCSRASAARGTAPWRSPARWFRTNAIRQRLLRSGLGTESDGLVDTGYPCRLIRESGAIIISAGPPGLVSIGGYRFALRELQDLIGRIDVDGVLAALPDRLAGQKLAGLAADQAAIREALGGARRQSAGRLCLPRPSPRPARTGGLTEASVAVPLRQT